MTKLVVCAREEEDYAIVHDSIPLILTGLLTLHNSIENWIKEKKMSKKRVSRFSFWFNKRFELFNFKNGFNNWEIVYEPYALLLVLENSIYQIISR